MSARGFGPFGVIIEDDMPRVAFVSDTGGGELVVMPDTLPDLRRALDWLESEWAAPDAGQPKLPLEAPDGQ